MGLNRSSRQSYYELTEHNAIQISVFFFILALSIFVTFSILLPLLKFILTNYLSGKVIDNGDFVPYLIEAKLNKYPTSPYFSWAVDIFIGTPTEARYWFNPMVSLFVPSGIIGMGMTLVVTALMPQNLGLIRQKIEREIAAVLDKIFYIKNGFHADNQHEPIVEEIMSADLRDMQYYSAQWKIPLEDLKALHKALLWRDSSFFYRLFHINDGMRTYMRFYFTVKYSNNVLGFVYMGAAVLIIIIGLRGLKFIPSTEPSMIFFALGLEFSLLITYAITLMYSRQDEEGETEQSNASSGNNIFMPEEFGSPKEVENLLRVFIKKTSKKE